MFLGLINDCKSTLRFFTNKCYIPANYLLQLYHLPSQSEFWPPSTAGSKINLTSFFSAQLADQLCHYPVVRHGNTHIMCLWPSQNDPLGTEFNLWECSAEKTCWVRQASRGEGHFSLIMVLNYWYQLGAWHTG